MKAIKNAVIAAVSLLFVFSGLSLAESTFSGLCLLENGTKVYAEESMETLFGTLAEGQVVYAEEQGSEGALKIVFIHPLLPAEGWISAGDALPLEGEALEDYLYGIGEDGMRYKNVPLLPVTFDSMAPGGTDAVLAFQDADTGEAMDEGTDEGEETFPATILRQPEDRQGRVGSRVIFSVEAENAVAYRWQFHNGRVWKDATMPGCDGPEMTVEVSQKRYAYMYRCILTFGDGTVLFSDEVRILH